MKSVLEIRRISVVYLRTSKALVLNFIESSGELLSNCCLLVLIEMCLLKNNLDRDDCGVVLLLCYLKCVSWEGE